MVSPYTKHHKTEVWAQLVLSKDDQERIHSFLVNEYGVRSSAVVKHMHVTIYHARRPLPGVQMLREHVDVRIQSKDFRFMVMAPGGENPRDDLEPSLCKVGVRLHRQSAARPVIDEYRARLISLETRKVLGARKQSNRTTSAFGARSYQPHMTLLHPKNHVPRDLTLLGKAFREKLGVIRFEEFRVDVVDRDA